jgi:nucleotide-binding universal stress UspA family protein
MYKRIMVPVDLAHADKLGRALDIAADLAKANGATLIYTGVGSSLPGSIAHSPKEFADKLQNFADLQRGAHGVPVEAHSIISHDPAVDLDKRLIAAAKETKADLVVMASHIPGLADHWFHGHAAYVAQNAPMSVFVVR